MEDQTEGNITEAKIATIESEKPQNPFFVVSNFGITASGDDLAPERSVLGREFGEDSVFAPSAATLGRRAYLKGENVDARNKRIAQEVLKKSDGRPLVISGSSQAANESLDQIVSLLENGLHDREVTLILSCVPGVVYSGPCGIVRLAHDFASQYIHMHEVEQHVTYPGPEVLYTEAKDKIVKSRIPVDEVFEDTPVDREFRRVKFLTLLPTFIPDNAERSQFMARLDDIDARIVSAYNLGKHNKVTRLRWKRALMLRTYKEKYFHGGQNDQETKDKYAQQYHETDEEIESMLGMLGQSLAYTSRILVDVKNGYHVQLAKVADIARKNGVKIKVALAVMEKDPLVTVEDLPKIVANFESVGHPLAYIAFFGNLAHQTVGQYPEAVVEMINAVMQQETPA